jgi:broad specificity phosphatase PhoE
MRAFLLFAILCAAVPARAQEMVFLVRHAEKADASRDPVLSQKGEARARALAALLRDAGVTAVWATELRRTQLTAKPLADARRLPVRVQAADDSAGLVAQVRKQQPRGRVLVVGHSNTVPEIAQAFGVREKIALSDDEYDALFVIVPGPGGARLLRLRQPDLR